MQKKKDNYLLKIIKPDSIRRMVINVAPKVMKEQNMNFTEAVDHIVESISGNETLSKAFPNKHLSKKCESNGFIL